MRWSFPLFRIYVFSSFILSFITGHVKKGGSGETGRRQPISNYIVIHEGN